MKQCGLKALFALSARIVLIIIFHEDFYFVFMLKR